MKKPNKHERFFGLRVSDEELRAIDFLAAKLERKRGDAVRVVIRNAARELKQKESVGGQAGVANYAVA